MRFIALLLMIILSGLTFRTESSPITAQIAYQGILTDSAGNSVADGSHSLEFLLYTDSAGGTAIWAEPKVVSIKNGLFSHMIGSIISLEALKFDMQYWLGVKYDGNEIGPRTRLGVVPYAKRAMVADSAGKVNGENIVANSIDSSKICNNGISTNDILNSTIKTEDVSNEFKAPMASMSDSAKWIRPSAITDGMIGTDQISEVDGSKINPNFVSRKLTADSAEITDLSITNIYSEKGNAEVNSNDSIEILKDDYKTRGGFLTIYVHASYREEYFLYSYFGKTSNVNSLEELHKFQWTQDPNDPQYPIPGLSVYVKNYDWPTHSIIIKNTGSNSVNVEWQLLNSF